MAAAPQSGQQDNSSGILWGIAALFAAIAGIWYAFKVQIVTSFLMLKLLEVNILNAVTNDYFDSLHQTIVASLASPDKLSYHDLVLIGSAVGESIRYPFVLLLMVLAVVIYLGHTTRVFKRTYSMLDLAKFEKENWPQINPVLDLNLLKTDIDKGPWAMAMTPIQFCKRHRLLEEIRPQRREGMSRKDWDKIEVLLKRGEANQVFALQLGPVWRGVDKLPLYSKALFAVFAARINADSKAAAAILIQLNRTCTTKLDFTGVDELIKKHINTKIVQQILNSHAYTLTVMASMLERARDDGVQASADFLWLKPVDRKLWYTLNTVGRQTPFVEVAGIFAHWMAEKEAGRKLVVPTVEEATKALELALKEVVYHPDEPVEESHK